MKYVVDTKPIVGAHGAPLAAGELATQSLLLLSPTWHQSYVHVCLSCKRKKTKKI